MAATIVALVLGFLAALSPAYTFDSLRSLVSRASWQTVWSLLDGNLGTGAYQADRLDPVAALRPEGNLACVPQWLTLLLFGGLYLWLWRRIPDEGEPRRVIRFTTLTVVIFFLGSRGWSPQWLGMLAPLLFLSDPLDRAVLYAVVLTFVNIARWPVLLSRGISHWLWATIPPRTGLFVLLLVELRESPLCAG